MLRRGPSLLVIFGLIMLMVIGAGVKAETIRLKNGRIFEGDVLEESEDEVKIEMGKGIMTFSPDEIVSIGNRQIAPIVPTPSPVLKKTMTKKSTKSSTPVAKKAAKKVGNQATSQNVVVKTEGLSSGPTNTLMVAAVTGDTSTITAAQAISTDTVISASSESVISPPAVTTGNKREAKRGVRAILFTIMAVLVIILLFLIISKRKSRV